MVSDRTICSRVIDLVYVAVVNLAVPSGQSSRTISWTTRWWGAGESRLCWMPTGGW